MLSLNHTLQNFRYFIENVLCVCVCDMKDFYGLFVFLIFTEMFIFTDCTRTIGEATLFQKALQNKLHTHVYA